MANRRCSFDAIPSGLLLLDVALVHVGGEEERDLIMTARVPGGRSTPLPLSSGPGLGRAIAIKVAVFDVSLEPRPS